MSDMKGAVTPTVIPGVKSFPFGSFLGKKPTELNYFVFHNKEPKSRTETEFSISNRLNSVINRIYLKKN